MLLAADLSQEIAHVVARHNAERYSYLKVLFLTSILLEFLGLDFGLARLSTTLLLDLPNSRTHELEGLSSCITRSMTLIIFTADKIGLKLTAKACFDPKAATQ
jgi:metalloendopeptidase OMA1, mitochondrial